VAYIRHHDNLVKSIGIGSLLSLLLLVFRLIIQPIITVNSGQGWDGAFYYLLAVGSPASVPLPYRFRIGLPLLIRYVVPGTDILYKFEAVNLACGLLFCVICYVAVSKYTPSTLTRMTAWLLNSSCQASVCCSCDLIYINFPTCFQADCARRHCRMHDCELSDGTRDLARPLDANLQPQRLSATRCDLLSIRGGACIIDLDPISCKKSRSNTSGTHASFLKSVHPHKNRKRGRPDDAVIFQHVSCNARYSLLIFGPLIVAMQTHTQARSSRTEQN
jgi:hypothetical protein